MKRLVILATLAAPPGVHLYLASRVDAEESGDGLVYRESGRISGFAWFGRGRNFVIAGDFDLLTKVSGRNSTTGSCKSKDRPGNTFR